MVKNRSEQESSHKYFEKLLTSRTINTLRNDLYSFYSVVFVSDHLILYLTKRR